MCRARSLLASSMKGRFSVSVNNFHSPPSLLLISLLCILGFSWAIFRLWPLDHTMKAFIGLLTCPGWEVVEQAESCSMVNISLLSIVMDWDWVWQCWSWNIASRHSRPGTSSPPRDNYHQVIKIQLWHFSWLCMRHQTTVSIIWRRRKYFKVIIQHRKWNVTCYTGTEIKRVESLSLATHNRPDTSPSWVGPT